MCNMEEIRAHLGDIDRAIKKIEQWQHETDDTLSKLDRADIDLIKDLTGVLRGQATNNLEYGKLLNELSASVAAMAFEIAELKRWQQIVSGKNPTNLAIERRAEQSKMLYRAIREGFNDAEFMELCLEVGIDFSVVSGSSVSEKAMWLVDHARRSGQFWKVANEVRAMRPNALVPVDTGQLS